MTFSRNTIILAILVGLILSCSDSKRDESINRGNLSHKLKSVEDPAEFENHYKTALIKYYNNRSDQPMPVDTVNGTASNAEDSSGYTTPPISGTNLQETGVDEADRIKTNGDLLFVLNSPDYYYYASDSGAESSQPPGSPEEKDRHSKIDIFELRPADADAEKLATLELDGPEIADGLYLYGDDSATRLAVTSSSTGIYQPNWYDSISWGGLSGSVTGVDVSNSVSPLIEESLRFSGQIISTRRIGGHLLVASRFFPQIEGINNWPQSNAEKSANEQLIRGLSLIELLPGYSYSSDSAEKPLVAVENCFVPESADSLGYSTDVISLVSIDLDDLSIADSLCFVGSTETFYASSSAVYLATTRYDWNFDEYGMADYHDPEIETDIHEFTFNDGQLDYAASGVVKGQLGWNVERRPFRLSEKDGFLRVVTFTAELEADKSPVRLTILESDGRELRAVSNLPNNRHPQPLGKPGEELYGSRFVGDRAYFVTFRVTDPLYVLDLSNPAEPFVAGELHIDGYSDYLHPIGETLLLGVGKDAIADESGDLQRGAWYQGVKISLIDVSDPSAPLELQTSVIGKRGTESPALRDHHAVTYLGAEQTGGLGKFAIPVSVHDGEVAYSGDQGKPWAWYNWSHTGLYLFDIDETNPVLSPRGSMKIAEFGSGTEFVSAENGRSVLIGDSVFYVNEEQVYGAFWNGAETINGPR